MKINYNVSAMIANNALNNNENKMSVSLGKLSTGYKINSAKDNPSGLAMARRMNAQIQSLKTADDNTNDGISIVETADGVLTEIQDMVQRMSELAIKASNDTMTDDDRAQVQKEIAQLKDEVTRVADTTQFNGQNLLDGSFDLRGYATVDGATDSKVKVSTYSDDTATGEVVLAGLETAYDADTNKVTIPDTSSLTLTTTADGKVYDATNMEINTDGDIITFSASDGMTIQLRVQKELTGGEEISLDLTGAGSMGIQVGANEGQTLEMRIPTISLSNMGIYNMDVSTVEGAREAIDQSKKGLQYISDARSRLGAYQNRLEHTDKSLDVTDENMTASYSRIMDVDMAEEMTEYTTQQVLTQAATSMLAQANERPADVLQLLQ